MWQWYYSKKEFIGHFLLLKKWPTVVLASHFFHLTKKYPHQYSSSKYNTMQRAPSTPSSTSRTTKTPPQHCSSTPPTMAPVPSPFSSSGPTGTRHRVPRGHSTPSFVSWPNRKMGARETTSNFISFFVEEAPKLSMKVSGIGGVFVNTFWFICKWISEIFTQLNLQCEPFYLWNKMITAQCDGSPNLLVLQLRRISARPHWRRRICSARHAILLQSQGRLDCPPLSIYMTFVATASLSIATASMMIKNTWSNSSSHAQSQNPPLRVIRSLSFPRPMSRWSTSIHRKRSIQFSSMDRESSIRVLLPFPATHMPRGWPRRQRAIEISTTPYSTDSIVLYAVRTGTASFLVLTMWSELSTAGINPIKAANAAVVILKTSSSAGWEPIRWIQWNVVCHSCCHSYHYYSLFILLW